MASALGPAASAPSRISVPSRAQTLTLASPPFVSLPKPRLFSCLTDSSPRASILSRKWKLFASSEESTPAPTEVQMPEPVEAQIEASTAGEAAKGEDVFAVVMIGSRQYIVFPGRYIYTQRLKGANVNDKIILNKVLLVGTRTKAYIGQPVVTNAAVHAVVEEQGLDPKVIIFKYKKKKNYRRTIGHRQPNTRIKITGITGYQDFPAETMPETIPA
ncbi:50S ribosomal protein L21, chloroplastic [Ananas comosus]|uniref:50S ribosomal protein L21, chloroplastic n=1 Tax=Ananas comosus TaxID=4615 RepID=A0A6P5F0U0_ANACO|nr:50S ribosomal protein L21, chloroplastic [Ananas comosus]